MARVFIGIPTINRPELVKHTIDSVRKQTFEDYLVIVSDNRSGEGVAETITKYITELNDKRFRFYVQPENFGEYGQGRYFFKEALGCDYFVVLHDDDVIHPEYLEKAITRLDQETECAVFIADPVLIDLEGKQNTEMTDQYLKEHGRLVSTGGKYDIIERHLDSGFTPISGTVFRYSAIQKTGFVEADRYGNYPFESDVFLRLGNISAIGWHKRQNLLSVRFHTTSMRHYIHLLDNEKAITSMLSLYESHSYQGKPEKRRKIHLARLYRALAFIHARQGHLSSCRKLFMKSFGNYQGSIKWWLSAPVALICPQLLRYILPPLPKPLEAPGLQSNTLKVK